MPMIYSVPTEDTKALKGAATYTGHTQIHPWPSLASPFFSAKGTGTTLLTEYAEAQRENCLRSLPVNSRAQSGPWTFRLLLRNGGRKTALGRSVIKTRSFHCLGCRCRTWSEN